MVDHEYTLAEDRPAEDQIHVALRRSVYRPQVHDGRDGLHQFGAKDLDRGHADHGGLLDRAAGVNPWVCFTRLSEQTWVARGKTRIDNRHRRASIEHSGRDFPCSPGHIEIDVARGVKVDLMNLVGQGAVQKQDPLGEAILTAEAGQNVLAEQVPSPGMIHRDNRYLCSAKFDAADRRRHLRPSLSSREAEDARAIVLGVESSQAGPLDYDGARSSGIEQRPYWPSVDAHINERKGESRIVVVGDDLEGHDSHLRHSTDPGIPPTRSWPGSGTLTDASQTPFSWTPTDRSSQSRKRIRHR